MRTLPDGLIEFPLVIAVTTYDIAAGRGLFRARGQVVKFQGYRKVLSPVGGKTDDGATGISGVCPALSFRRVAS